MIYEVDIAAADVAETAADIAVDSCYYSTALMELAGWADNVEPTKAVTKTGVYIHHLGHDCRCPSKDA